MEVVRLPVGELEANCYLLVSGATALVIDPGDGAETVIRHLKERGVRPTAIVFTHGHYDHILGAKRIREEFGVPIWAHQAEAPWPSMRIDRRLSDQERIEADAIVLTVIHTPGHSLGSICLAGPGQIFTGDTLFIDTCGRTDLPGGSPSDMLASLARLAGTIGAGDQVYPGHGRPYAYETGMVESIIRSLQNSERISN